MTKNAMNNTKKKLFFFSQNKYGNDSFEIGAERQYWNKSNRHSIFQIKTKLFLATFTIFILFLNQTFDEITKHLKNLSYKNYFLNAFASFCVELKKKTSIESIKDKSYLAHLQKKKSKPFIWHAAQKHQFCFTECCNALALIKNCVENSANWESIKKWTRRIFFLHFCSMILHTMRCIINRYAIWNVQRIRWQHRI